MSIRRIRFGDVVAASPYRHALLAAMRIFLMAPLFPICPNVVPTPVGGRD